LRKNPKDSDVQNKRCLWRCDIRRRQASVEREIEMEKYLMKEGRKRERVREAE
jgi:hypothetical protein